VSNDEIFERPSAFKEGQIKQAGYMSTLEVP
jgi:hypothetical protein